MFNVVVRDTTESFLKASNESLTQTARFLPNLIIAIIIFLFGVFLASLVKKLIIKFLESVKFENWLSKYGVSEALKKAGSKITTSDLLGELVRWFIILVFLIPAVELLGLSAVNEILTRILLYIPNVIVAVIIVAVGIVFGNIARDLVAATAAGLGAHSSSIIGQVARWSIFIFAFLAALNQLGVATELIRILFTGFVAMIAIAGGLAFGLGGKETAEKVLKALRRDFLDEPD